ncbi:hypothetical protein, partial [Pseudomonas jessenii]|uniref:hypothetical protein n=1 Tax=Pseudomonas jessenii TaxID=77298 RepID=UPI0019D44677
TTLRSPAPEAGVSTNFTIWAVSATLSVVDGAHYTERLFNCKPPESKKPGKFRQWSSKQLCSVDRGL